MTAAVLLSLGSAATFGAADFLGGLASRRSAVLPVTLLSQAIGLVILVAVMPFLSGTVSVAAIAWGMVAGIGGAGGLLAYFRALSISAMGVTAPIASLLGAAVPLVIGLGLGERPGATAAIGIAVGITATVLVSYTPRAVKAVSGSASRQGLIAAIGAGALFGLFFVALDQAPADSGLWPLVGARGVGLAMVGGIVLARSPGWPDRQVTGIATVSGLLDMCANVLFLLASREGLLALTAVVTGLYPVGVVILAWIVLRERLGRSQMAGVGLALVATALIAS